MSSSPVRSFTLLVNPASGGGGAAAAVVPAARLLREAGARVDVTYSPGPAAMPRLVCEAVDRGDVVVSVGGDGMLSSLAGEVAAAGGSLGLLPAGRGNDFARMLGVPDDVAAQARLLLDGAVRRVDLVDVTRVDGSTRTVAGSVYSGIDARAAALVDRLHRLPRRLQYPVAAVAAVATYRPARFAVTVDGEQRRFDAALVVVANSGYYGKGMHVAPAAVLDDGLLDVVVVEASSKPALVRSMPTLYDGSHVDLPQVTVLRGARVTLAADAPAPVPVGGDGESLGVLPASTDPRPLEVAVRPSALDVLAPA